MQNSTENKPHHGRISDWKRVKVEVEGDPYGPSLGYLITCKFIDHFYFHGSRGHTSLIVKHEGNEIETLNSRYTLVGEENEAS